MLVCWFDCSFVFDRFLFKNLYLLIEDCSSNTAWFEFAIARESVSPVVESNF